MDHTYARDWPLPSDLTSSRAFQGANNAQQSFRRLVRRRAQLPRAQVRAGRVRRRAGGAVPWFQGAACAVQRRRRRYGKSETTTSDQEGHGNKIASADAASRKGGAGVEEAVAWDERGNLCPGVSFACKVSPEARFRVRLGTCYIRPYTWYTKSILDWILQFIASYKRLVVFFFSVGELFNGGIQIWLQVYDRDRSKIQTRLVTTSIAFFLSMLFVFPIVFFSLSAFIHSLAYHFCLNCQWLTALLIR